MEALSAVASGMAVASLSIQLLQSVGTIKSFIRDVKGASKELERLETLLDRLNALLEDVHDVMERQTSLQGQHFPAPSQMIFDALKSCEGSLEALQSVIVKYKRTSNGNTSTVKKLKDDIKFSFKAKDIAEFEVRMQREIDHLHAALGLNSTKILMSTLPILLQRHQACTTIISQPCPQQTLAQASTTSAFKQESPLSNDFSTLTTLKTQCWTSTTLEWLGVYQKRSVQYILQKKSKRHRSKYSMEDAISESREILITWSFLKIGLHWDRRYPYGNFSLCPSTYPIVHSLGQFGDLMQSGSVEDVQQRISSGALHPYVRDVYGESLLHLAARYHRADVCRLLIQHGLRPTLSTNLEISPLYRAMHFRIWPSPISDEAETIRLLLHSCDQIDDFEAMNVPLAPVPFYPGSSLDTLEWMWINAAAVLDCQELLHFRVWILRGMVEHLSYSRGDHEASQCISMIVKLMNAQLLEYYLAGNFGLLKTFYWVSYSSLDSQVLGALFLDLLTRLGLDVEASMNRELELLPGGLLEIKYNRYRNRKVVWEALENGAYLLRWIWVLDESAPGYLLVSEHIGLGPDGLFEIDWPFFEDPTRYYGEGHKKKWTKVKERSIRRLANHARKERTRTGQKLPRSRMPGAWNW